MTFGTTIGSGGFRFYDANHTVAYNYVQNVVGGAFQGPLMLDSGDAEGTSTNLAGHWRVVNALVERNVIVGCPEGIRFGNNYSLAPTGCTVRDNLVVQATSGTAITTLIAPVNTTIGTNPYFSTPTAAGLVADSAGIYRKDLYGPRLTFLQPGDVGIAGDPNDSDGTGALVSGGGGAPPPPPVDTTTAAGRWGWGVPMAISDEFDYVGVPDPNKWSLPGLDWAGHAGNGRRRPERQTVQDGRLIMTGLANGDSGWMAHKMNRQYGRYEVRVRSFNTASSNGNEYSPVLLIWPTSDSRKADGEYDYHEPGSPGAQSLTAFMHFPGDGDQQRQFSKSGVDMSQWHNIALEWSPEWLRGFLDGEVWFTTSGGADSTRNNIQSMPSGFATIQLDNFNGTNETPASFEVEFFRVYSLTPTLPPAGAQTVTVSGILTGERFGTATMTGAAPAPSPGTHPTLLGTTDTVLGSTTLGTTGGVGTGFGTVRFGSAPFGSGVAGTQPPPTGAQIISRLGAINSAQLFGQPLIEVADGPQQVVGIGVDSVAAYGSPTVTAGTPPTPAPGGVLAPGLYAVGLDGTTLTPLPDWAKISVVPQRNSPGTLTVDYPAGAPGFNTLRDGVSAYPLKALEVRVWLGGNATGALGGWLVQKAGDDLTPGSNWTFSGHFHEWLLTKALVSPQNRDAANPKGELRFAGATAGTILGTLMDQASSRGALPLVTRDFSPTHDSNGLPWANQVSSLNLSPKTTVAQVADKLVELGLCEYELTAARVWRAYNPGTRGTDRTIGASPLTFAQAINLREHSRRESAKDAGTAVLAAGSEGFYSWAESATALAELGWRAEVGVDAGQLGSADAVFAFASTYLEAIRHGVAEYVGQIEFAVGAPLPLIDWGIGDWAYGWVGTTRRRLRLSQIGLEFQPGQPPVGTVALNDLITDKVAALYRRLNAISSGDAVVGTSTASAGGAGDDKIPPSAPDPVTLSSTIGYQQPGETLTLAVIQAGWAAVTTNAYADTATATKAAAAPLIAQQIRSGQPLNVDWTWVGAPSVVIENAPGLVADLKTEFPIDTPPYRSRIAEDWLRRYPQERAGGGAICTDVAGYRVQYTYLGAQNVSRDPLAGAGTDPLTGLEFPADAIWTEPTESPTQNTSITFGQVEGDRSVGVRVASIDQTGNQGPWSQVAAVQTAFDNQPPPPPSAPVGVAWFRTIKWTWDGKGSAGEDMLAAAPDFATGGFVELHVGVGIDFTPDRPTISGKVDLSLSSTFVANLYAAGTWNQSGLTIGGTYFARFVAVDRNGNASDPSATSDGVSPQQLVNIDIGPDAIGREQIIDAEIVRAKIADLAVNSAKIEEIDVGKLTAGTMTAQVTLSGRFSTPIVNGNQLQFDNAGIRLIQGGTVIGSWQVSDASMLVTGTYLSGLEGERINILPDGTLRFYPAAGLNYSQMSNVGSDVVWRGPIDVFGRSGRVNVNILGVGINFSAESEVPNNLRAEMAVFDRRARITTPFTSFEVDRRYTSPVGGVGSGWRIQFVTLDASGVQIGVSGISYMIDPATNAGGMVGNDAGWKLDRNGNGDGRFMVTNGTLTGFGVAQATAWDLPSSQEIKQDIADARVLLDPLRTIGAARAAKFRFREGVAPADGRTYLGILAEHLPPVLQREIDIPGGGTTIGADVNSLIGVLWGAMGQVIDQQALSVTGGALVMAGVYRTGDVAFADVTWDQEALAVPTDVTAMALPSMPTALGRVRARVVPGSISVQGCRVQLTFSGPANVVVTGNLPLAVEVVGRYLWQPPPPPPEETPPEVPPETPPETPPTPPDPEIPPDVLPPPAIPEGPIV